MGASIVEVIASIVILSLCSVIALSMIQYIGNRTNTIRSKENLSILKQKILNTLSNQSAWEYTLSKNASMQCRIQSPSSCTNGTNSNFDLYDAIGNMILSSGNTFYRRDGSQCAGAATTSEDCPVSLKLGWKIECNSLEECKYPSDLIQIYVAFDKVYSLNNFNESFLSMNWTNRRNISATQSPIAVCASTNEKIFIGFGKSKTDGSGKVYSADANGCVDKVAFKGRQGFSGVNGTQGVQGSQGDIYPKNKSLPPTDIPFEDKQINAICNSTADYKAVCSAFKSVLTRPIDFSNLHLYYNLYLSNSKNASIIKFHMSNSLEAQAQALAGKYNYPKAIGPYGIQLDSDVYPGGKVQAVIDQTNVTFQVPVNSSLTPEQAYASYINAAQAKGLDINKKEVIGGIENAVIKDIILKITKK